MQAISSRAIRRCSRAWAAGRDRDVADLPAAGEPHDTRVNLASPSDIPAGRLHRMRDCGEPGFTGDMADQVSQQLGGDPWVRWDGPLGVDRVDAVEAEDGVEVDQPASLELGDLGIGEFHPYTALPGNFGELATQGDHCSLPQFGRVRVPHHGARIVVAVGAQRTSQADPFYWGSTPMCGQSGSSACLP